MTEESKQRIVDKGNYHKALFDAIVSFSSLSEALFTLKRVYSPNDDFEFENSEYRYNIKARYITGDLIRECFRIKSEAEAAALSTGELK